jgi:hypothetical protein
MNKPFYPVVALLLMLSLSSCQFQGTDGQKKTDPISFTKKYNARINDQDLLLGCIVYAEESTRHLSMDSSGDFYKITAILQDNTRAGYPMNKADSSIDQILAMHPNLDFRSDKAMFRIKRYIDCYKIVDDLIFGKIDSDDKSDEMKILEDKILKVPAMLAIYRLYVPEGSYLGSLPSSGVALNVHMAYYLSTLDLYKRAEILKSLL